MLAGNVEERAGDFGMVDGYFYTMVARISNGIFRVLKRSSDDEKYVT